MKKISTKQARRNREIAQIKKALSPFCTICRMPACDAAHVLPKSLCPAEYTNPKNIVPMCRRCHNSYDNDIDFRRLQPALYDIAREIDTQAAIRHFDLQPIHTKII